MKKIHKINEAEAVAETTPETKAEGGKAPADTEKPGEAGGLVDINKGPEEVLKALVPDFKPAGPGADVTYTISPEIKAKLLGGKKDGEEGDEIIKLESKSITARQLIPTQADIDVDKSFADQIYKLFGNLEVAIDGKGGVQLSPEAPKKGMVKSKQGQFPILTFAGKYIIDGHHRWSQICMTNPDCTLKTADIVVEGITDPKAIQGLMHVILLGVYGQTKVKNVGEGSKNLLKLGPNDIKKIVIEGEGMKGNSFTKPPIPPKTPIKPEALKLLKQAGLIKEETAEAAAEMYAKNLEVLKKCASQSPVQIPRAFMPQPLDSGDASGFTVGGDVTKSDAVAPAAAGDINFKAPFESKVIKTFEKFMTKWKKGEI